MIAALRRAVLAACALAGCNEILDNRDFPAPVVDANPVVDCAAIGKSPTTLTGTVFAPNGTLPINHALVYVPTGDLDAIPDGPHGPTCASGAPMARSFSNSDGSFHLPNVPAGAVRLVIQVGKWRREVMVPDVAACSETAVDAALTRLPRTSDEGHIPRIAISTGHDDTLECLARDIGIADSEIASPAGRVRFYVGNGTGQFDGGAAFESRGVLTTASALNTYDAVLLGCEGRSAPADPTGASAMFDFVHAGGWLWLTHYEYHWLDLAPAPWSDMAVFDTQQQTLPMQATLLIDKGNAQGTAFAAWLDALHVSEMPDTLAVALAARSCRAADSTMTARLLYLDPAVQQAGVQLFTWDAPENGGRLVFSDVHHDGLQQQAPPAYPTECMAALPQELAVAYQLFDAPTCAP